MSPSQTPRLTGSGGRRLFVLVIGALIGVPLAVILLATGAGVAAALSGTAIEASRWRDAAAQRASAALGRPVVLEGALEFEPRLSREWGVRVGSLRVLNPPGFTGREFLAIGELRARIDLFEALRGRLRSSTIEARDVEVRPERGADGVGNWPASRPGSRPQQPAVDIARFMLRGLAIHYHDARTASHRFIELDELSGSAGRARAALTGDGAEAWPFTVEAVARGARLHAAGALDAVQRTARVQFDVQADDLAPFERLLGTPPPDFGKASVQCVVDVAPDSVTISGVHGRLGESRFSGQLTLAFGGARPRISGSLNAAALDLRPFLAAQPQADGRDPGNETPGPQALLVRDFAAFDADIDLSVERWVGLNTDIRDARFAWRADERGVRIPMSATIAGVPLAGGLELDTSAPTPTLALRLDASDVVLEDLVLGLGAASPVEGTVGRVRLRVEGRGDTTAALARDLKLSLALAAARLRFGSPAGAGPVAVSIDTLELAAGRGDRLRGHANGSLLGQRAKLKFRGGDVTDMLRERVLPLELDLALAEARLRADGTLALAGSTRDTALRFDFRADRAGDLHWLGVPPQATLPVALRGQLRLADAAWMLDGTTLELGRSQLTIDARIAPVAGRSRIVASAHSALIDAPELSTLRAGSDDRPGGPRSDAPALSAGFDLPDADVEFRLRRLRLDRTDLEDLAFVAHTRDGRLLPVSVTGRVVGTPFAADVEMDLQALPPSASLALTAGAIDVGALLRGLGIAEDIEGHVQALNVQVLGRGSTASEWVARSGFDVRVSGGSLVVRGAARSALAEMHVGEARISAVAGEPVQARLDGEIGRIPLTVEVTSGTLAAFARDARHVPFALVARSAGTHLGLDGEVSLPLGSGGKLNLVMRGERLDTLSALARVELPAWGPWSFSSPIHMTATGYKLPSLHASVGDSRLSGSAALDLSGPRPSLDLQVVAPAIQLDDFPLPERLTDSAAKSDDDRDLRQSASRMARHTNKLLSAGFLRRLDATIDVKAKEVLSGSDRLADGAIRLTLENGRLRIDPAVVNLPAGVARVSISYEPKGSVVDLGLAVRVERFDYGILARRFDRTAHLSGLFSLDLALFGSAGSLEEIRRNASGRVDFAVWPAELSGGMFNLWSVNLLLQLLPLVDPDTRPTVNCIIGRFDLDRGDLRDDKLLIDTSAVRIRGSGHANLSTEELEFTFRPRAKGFALFRLQTPLRVSGTLGDQRFGFSRFDVVESALRLVASPILLPLERFTLGPLPRDGADVCTNPMRAGLTPAAASTAP